MIEEAARLGQDLGSVRWARHDWQMAGNDDIRLTAPTSTYRWAGTATSSCLVPLSRHFRPTLIEQLHSKLERMRNKHIFRGGQTAEVG